MKTKTDNKKRKEYDVKLLGEQVKKVGQAAEEAAKSFNDISHEDSSECRRLEAVEKIRQVIKTGDWKYCCNDYHTYYKFGKWRVKESGGYSYIKLKGKTIEIFTAEEEKELKELFDKRVAEIEKRDNERERAAQIDQLLTGEPKSWLDKLFFFFGYSRI